MYEMASRIAIAIRWTVICSGILTFSSRRQAFLGNASDAHSSQHFAPSAGVSYLAWVF